MPYVLLQLFFIPYSAHSAAGTNTRSTKAVQLVAVPETDVKVFGGD